MNELQMLLVLGVLVFSVGLFGIIVRRNLLVMLMCVELMLNSANLCFVVFSKMHQKLDGQLIVLFAMTIAATESAIGLGLIIAMYRTLRTVESENLELLRD